MMQRLVCQLPEIKTKATELCDKIFLLRVSQKKRAKAESRGGHTCDSDTQQWGIEPALLSRLDATIAAQRKSALG